MKPLPHQDPPQSPPHSSMRVIRIEAQPKTWWGKLIAGIVGIALLLVAFFLSLFLFAWIASLLIVAFLYFAWKTSRIRRDQAKAGEDGRRD